MKLRAVSPDELQPALAGVHAVRPEPEGLFLDRMPPPLAAHYAAPEGTLTRARCPSGVRIRFRSDTPHLRFSLRFGRQARPLNHADLVVDGVFLNTFKAEPTPGAACEARFDNPAGRERFYEIWLPHVAEAWLTALELAPDASFRPEPFRPADTWLAIGDSITQGMAASAPALTWPALAARALACGLHNTAVGGAKMHPAAGAVAAIPCAFATVAFGCNDWNQGKPLDQFEKDAARLLETLFAAKPGLPVALLTPFPAVRAGGEQNSAGQPLEDYRDRLRRLAPRFPAVQLIEGPSLVPADPACFTDGIHPNNAGMAVIARNIRPHLEKLLKASPQ